MDGQINIFDAILFKMPDLEIYETGKEFFENDLLDQPFDFCRFEIPNKYFKDQTVVIVSKKIGKHHYHFNLCTRNRDGSYEKQKVEFSLIGDAIQAPGGLEENCYAVFQLWLTCCTILNLKEYDKEKVTISEKLQKARKKRNKPLLSDYIKVRMKPVFSDALKCEVTGTIKKPHWRRGHLRRYKSGKIIIVNPCMVNFSGQEIRPKNYKL